MNIAISLTFYAIVLLFAGFAFGVLYWDVKMRKKIEETYSRGWDEGYGYGQDCAKRHAKFEKP